MILMMMMMILMKTDVHLHSLVGTLAGEGGTHSVAANPRGPDILVMTIMIIDDDGYENYDNHDDDNDENGEDENDENNYDYVPWVWISCPYYHYHHLDF